MIVWEIIYFTLKGESSSFERKEGVKKNAVNGRYKAQYTNREYISNWTYDKNTQDQKIQEFPAQIIVLFESMPVRNPRLCVVPVNHTSNWDGCTSGKS